eukprot:scaffold15792_cov214-Alexandrium_tamarense.AAC.1
MIVNEEYSQIQLRLWTVLGCWVAGIGWRRREDIALPWCVYWARTIVALYQIGLLRLVVNRRC